MVQLNYSLVWKKRTVKADSYILLKSKEIRKRAVLFYSELYMSENTEADELDSSFYVGLPKSTR